VLFSPACASFDQFRDYEQRGDSFRKLVAELTGSPEASPTLFPAKSAA
jgi:UDP-N-acetylmuramoylalanine--D-glutamate ligase